LATVKRTKRLDKTLNIKTPDGERVKFEAGQDTVTTDEQTAVWLVHAIPYLEIVKESKPKKTKDESALTGESEA
jgi:hypothetical protein